MRMLCTQCGNIFDYKDAKVVEKKLYNVTRIEKHCPNCDSYAIEDMYHWRYLDKFLKFSYTGIN
jgi:hypothetical protein